MTQLEDLLQQCTVKLSLPGQLGWGTGFFVAPGLILTCAHVMRKAADLQVTVVYPAQQQPLSAIVKAKADDGKTLDLALVELSEPLPDHPCVLLDKEPVAIGQALYSYGYLESYTNAAPVRPVHEGLTGDTPPLLKLQGAQIEKGISGAALLNLKTGRVCGILKETRAAGFDLGGGAIPTSVILEQFPQLRELQREFHGGDRRWSDLLRKGAAIDFRDYLGAIATTYAKWWQLYTLTDAEGKQRQAQESAPMFDFRLMVQTVPKQEREQDQQAKEKEKVERFSVLDGLRKYALGSKPEPVLLVGRPGSGKSTALARLMLEEATTQKSDFLKKSDFSAHSLRIPVLVELRYWQGSIAQLILDALHRHELAVSNDQLETVLAKALLLFDGVNELPSEEARSQLIAFRHTHPKVPMIFTTRDLSLGGDLGIEKKLEMQPLTETQMQAFVQAYIPGKAEAMLRQLKERLRDFGKTPLLLWMLCEVFDQTPNQQLPNNLAGIFQLFTRIYADSSVRKHEVAVLKGDVRPLSDRRLWKPALMHLASVMMEGQERVDFRVVIDRSEAEKALQEAFPNESFPVRDILDDLLKFHLLQYSTSDRIEFRHQLIQEYYSAEWLLARVRNLDDYTLKRDYLNYLKWTEPLALMLALVDDEALAVRVVEQALDVDLMLGARLAGEIDPRHQDIAIKLIQDYIIQEAAPEWLEVELLGRIKSSTTKVYLSKFLNHPDVDLSERAAFLIGNSQCKEAIEIASQNLKQIDEIYFSQSFRGGPDKNGDIWIKRFKSLIFLDPQSAFNYLKYNLFDPGKQASIIMITWHHAAEALIELDEDRDVFTNLVERLKKPLSIEEGVNYIANMLNGSVRDESEAIQIFQTIEQQPEDSVQASILSLLREIHSPSLEQEMILLLPKAKQKLKGEISKQIINRKPQSLTVLEGFLTHSDPELVWITSLILANLKNEIALPHILSILDSSQDPCKRREAATALVNFEPKKVTAQLLRSLKYESESMVRQEVAFTLSQFGKREAIPELNNPIEKGLGLSIFGIRGMAKLSEIKLLWDLIEPQKKECWQTAVVELLKLGQSKAKIFICDLIVDIGQESFSTILELIPKYADDEIINWLLEALENPERHTLDKYFLNRVAFSLNRCKPELLSKRLPQLKELNRKKHITQLNWLMPATQSLCRFYNYEIYHSPPAKPQPTQQSPPATTINAEIVQIIENNKGTIIGKQP